MKHYWITGLLVLFSLMAAGQGTVRGKVTDDKGEPVYGVTVIIKSRPTLGALTDFDGNYSLKVPDSTAQVLVYSSIGYKTTEQTVSVHHGEVAVKNVLLYGDAKDIPEVVVQAKAVKAKDYYVEAVKKNAATILDYISSETIKKTGDMNVQAAVTRVAGVSTNGQFITVRGIGDRYVQTTVNGSRIPTLDPFTNNIKLDLIPAFLVDNVIITKTASPDLPGDWAAAYISVETKDYPEQLGVNVETSFGYNDQSSFKEVLSSERSSTDWLGFDNGLRSYNHDNFVPANMSPTQYQQLVALGLGSYYQSLGVNGWVDNSPAGNDYFKLGLVQLGLLAPAQFNDDAAYQQAKNLYYTGPYTSQAFTTINAAVPASSQAFANNWNTTTRTAPINFSQSFSIGNQTTLFKKPLGYIFGFRYGSSVLYSPDSYANRLRGDGFLDWSAQEMAAKETNNWSSLLSLSYKFSPEHTISFMFMPNFSGVNNARNSFDNRSSENITHTVSQNYEERQQWVYQLKTEHYFPASKIKGQIDASYTDGNSSNPDFKNLQYWHNPATNTYQIGGAIGDGVHRYYRYLSDNLFDGRASIEFPVKGKSVPGKLKLGGAYQKSDKKNDQYDYMVSPGPYAPPLLNSDLNQYYNPSAFGFSTVNVNGINQTTINQIYTLDNSVASHTFGHSETVAGFAMLDYYFTPRLRFSGGLRVEHAKIFTDVFLFDSLGYGPGDIRRDYKNGYPAANPGKLDEMSYLPSFNLVYKLKNDEAAPVNLRANFSKSVARPSIREMSDVAVYDYDLRAPVYGNSSLKMVNIYNYDLRLESYFKSGDNVSVSVFYKDFDNHIELINLGGYSWENVKKSHVAGVELEGSKKISRHFDFKANLTLVKSETEFVRSNLLISNGVKTYIPMDTINRSMFGQAPYAVNGILTYTQDSLGLNITASYNVQGERLVISSNNPGIPDVYEMPRHLVDLKVAKSLGKHFSLTFTVKDLLNTPVNRRYQYTSTLYDSYTWGTNYILGINYKL